MKRTKYCIMLLAALASVLSGCRRDETVTEGKDALVRIYLSTPGAGTRAAGDPVPDTEAERALSRVDVFAYDHSDGTFLGGTSVTPSDVADITNLEIKVASRPVDIYAVANASEAFHATCGTRAAILSAVSSFTDNSASSFVMTASKLNVDPTSGETVNLELQRIASKVVLGSVKKDLSIASKQNSDVKVKDVRLVNVRRQVKLFDAVDPAPAAAAASYINPQSFVEKGTGMIGAAGLDIAVTAAGSAVDKTLYFYPNAAAEAASVTGDDWVTKLVLTVEIDGETYYYPVGLPQDSAKSGRNLVYQVSSVTLKLLGNPGEDSPNHYLSERSAEVSLDVLDWDELDLKPKFAAEMPVFTVEGLTAFSTATGTKTLTITSRQTNMLQQVTPLSWTMEISTDHGTTWTSTFPSWMKPSKTAGEGSATGSETVTLTYNKGAMGSVSVADVYFRFSQAESGRRLKLKMTE